jgi:hypothetical protein
VRNFIENIGVHLQSMLGPDLEPFGVLLTDSKYDQVDWLPAVELRILLNIADKVLGIKHVTCVTFERKLKRRKNSTSYC